MTTLQALRVVSHRFSGDTGWTIPPPQDVVPLLVPRPEWHVRPVPEGLDLRVDVAPGWPGIDPALVDRITTPDVLVLVLVLMYPVETDARLPRVQSLARQALRTLRELRAEIERPILDWRLTDHHVEAMRNLRADTTVVRMWVTLHEHATSDRDHRILEALYDLLYAPPACVAHVIRDSRGPVDKVITALESLVRSTPGRPVWFDHVRAIVAVNGAPITADTRGVLDAVAQCVPRARGRPGDWRALVTARLVHILKDAVRTTYGEPLTDSQAADLVALLCPTQIEAAPTRAARRRVASRLKVYRHRSRARSR